MKFLFFITVLLTALSSRAQQKPYEAPECAAIAKACMAAKYEPKKMGHGLFADCIGKIARGQKVEGVTGQSQDAAKKCVAFAKSKRGGGGMGGGGMGGGAGGRPGGGPGGGGPGGRPGGGPGGPGGKPGGGPGGKPGGGN